MKLCLLSLLILLTFANNNVNCAKILAVAPVASKSHWSITQPLFHELARSGHEVTVISPYPIANPPKNYRDIPVVEMIEKMPTGPASLKGSYESPIKIVKELYNLGFVITNLTLNHPNVQQILHSNETFDLVVVELFMNEALLGLGAHFNAPVVVVMSTAARDWINDLLGSPMPLSYVPHIFIAQAGKLSFTDRLLNTFVTSLNLFLKNTYSMKIQEELYNKVFKNPKPSFDKVLRNGISLGLVNSHFSINYPQPLLPNTVEVGGFHLNIKSKPLPDNLKQFIESAEHGVVYFSLGSHFDPTRIPREKLDHIYNALIHLKQKVLWKLEPTDLFPKHKNILIQKWFPQDDILAHPKSILFVTHGGWLSCMEAVHHGIPIIGMPIFGDQHMNMAQMAHKGVGVVMAFSNLTQSSFSWALNEVLSNTGYKERAVEASRRFRDQPMPPLETAKFWVEYVIRHKGAPHLHSAGQDLSFIEYHMLDVWATILGVVVLLLFIILFTVKFVLRKIFGKRKTDLTKKKS